MDITQIITTAIVTIFSGSGLIAVIINNKANKKSRTSGVLESIKSSVDELMRSRNDDHKQLEELSKDITRVSFELNDLTKESLRVDSALTKSISIIISALEDGHINGEGRDAKIVVDNINSDIANYQEKLISKR